MGICSSCDSKPPTLPDVNLEAVDAGKQAQLVFKQIDVNGDGFISQVEFVKHLRSHGELLSERSAEGAMALTEMVTEFQKMDADGDKKISYDELNAFLLKKAEAGMPGASTSGSQAIAMKN
ncbi:unnamed protein product [Polarella glacialis]|uniref:EF-hand domain-containing protein n=1 Tax=Polarella glacialis TaxID=89957 RepID=A0A813FMR9_POLGL|nr:unnamed protein product [Polarella glacialis]